MIIPYVQATPHRREAVLAAALELFEERTYAGCAMPLVAERAAVGAGTIYRYFASKEALANALYQRWKAEMASYLFATMAPDEEPRAAFGHLWHQLLAFAADHPQALAFLETHKHAPYLDDDSRAASAAVDAAALAMVERLQSTGAVRTAPPAEVIALVFGAFVGLTKAIDAGAVTFDDALVTRTEHAVWHLLSA